MRIAWSEAARTVTRCVCSDCWGPLMYQAVKDDRELAEISCGTEGCECRGWVSKAYVAKQLSKSQEELWEARDALRAAAPWVAKAMKKSEKDALAELGF